MGKMRTQSAPWRAAAVLASVLLVGGVAACGNSDTGGGGTKDDGKITMGFSQVGAESGWRTANTEVDQGGRRRRPGIELKFSDAQQKQENQIKAIRSYIQQKVDVIAFSPVVESGWDTVLKEAKDAKHPGHPDRPRGRLEGHVALQDLPRLGLRQGGQAGRRVAGRAEARPPRRPGEHRRAAGHHRLGAGERPQEGLRARSSPPNPNLKIIASQTGDFTRADGKQVMEAFLQGQPEDRRAVRAQRRHGSRCDRGDRGRRQDARQGHQDHHDRRRQGRHAGPRRRARSTSSSSATRCSARS